MLRSKLKNINPGLYDEFKDLVIEESLGLGKTISAALILFVPPFYFVDEFFLGVSPATIIFRFLPVLIAVTYLAVYFVNRIKFKKLLLLLYRLMFMSFVLMILGLVIVASSTEHYMEYLNASLACFLLAYLFYSGDIAWLIFIFAFPLAGAFTVLAMLPHTTLFHLSVYFILLPVVAALIIFSRIQVHTKFREFNYSKIVENKNRELNIRNEQMLHDLKLARQIQENLLPEKISDFGNIDISTFYKPMEEVGGDFYELVLFRESKKLGIFLSDVTGHGVPAALIASMLKSIIITSGENKNSPEQLLNHINEVLRNTISGSYVTALYGIYDTERDTFRFARGGHSYPKLIRNDKVTDLRSSGVILGPFSDAKIECREIHLKKGDKLLLFTDGLQEAMNNNGELFDSFCFDDILARLSGKPVHECISGIMESLEDFTESDTFDDDICIVGLEVK